MPAAPPAAPARRTPPPPPAARQTPPAPVPSPSGPVTSPAERPAAPAAHPPAPPVLPPAPVRSPPAPPVLPPGPDSSPPAPAARPPGRPVAPARPTPASTPATATVRSGADRAPSTAQATAILAAGTFASRLTGFLRVLAIGYVLGVTSLSDAFNYANGVPNIIYDLLLGGILSATLIPVFVDQLRGEDRAENMRAISAVVTAIVVALAGVSALLWLLAPWVIHFYLLLNPASTGGAERALATRLLHDFAPQVFFLGAIVVSTALLNARRNFTAAAFSPVVNNLIAIGALLATKAVASGILTTKSTNPASVLERFGQDQHAIWVLGIGTTAGYVAQLLVQLPAMHRTGFRLRPVWDLHHPIVRRVAHLSTWLIGVVLANQVALALVMILAGKVPGGVTAYQFSYQFFQLPYALVVVSVASAMMPDLSERWASGDKRGFERQFVAGLRVTLAVIIPVSFVYIAIAQPFVQLAVHHGRVTQSGAHLVSSSLVWFAAGLPGFSAFFLLMRLYQAMQKARVMFWIYVLENGLTVIAALILDPLLGIPGLALAWIGPYTIAAMVAAYDLRRRVGTLGGMHTIRALLRIFAASGVATAAVLAVSLLFRHYAGDVALVARLVVEAVVGTVVYLGLARAIGIKELRPVARLVRRLSGGG
jgi:putative peptidoglycan lipid II flippase